MYWIYCDVNRRSLPNLHFSSDKNVVWMAINRSCVLRCSVRCLSLEECVPSPCLVSLYLFLDGVSCSRNGYDNRNKLSMFEHSRGGTGQREFGKRSSIGAVKGLGLVKARSKVIGTINNTPFHACSITMF